MEATMNDRRQKKLSAIDPQRRRRVIFR